MVKTFAIVAFILVVKSLRNSTNNFSMVLAQDLQDMVVLNDTSGMENIYEYEIQMENNVHLRGSVSVVRSYQFYHQET